MMQLYYITVTRFLVQRYLFNVLYDGRVPNNIKCLLCYTAHCYWPNTDLRTVIGHINMQLTAAQK